MHSLGQQQADSQRYPVIKTRALRIPFLRPPSIVCVLVSDDWIAVLSGSLQSDETTDRVEVSSTSTRNGFFCCQRCFCGAKPSPDRIKQTK